ncbi:MAG TPA: hypothetical protein VFB66_26355 [Tepidisphaeraceae bacterium]|nr:hypothetical protein [Tepidisphaeraceae bacterium]
MKVLNGAIYSLDGKPLINRAIVELDEEPGVTVWGGHFRLPHEAPPIEVFKPMCVIRLEDGRQGTVRIGKTDRHAAYFLGKGALEPINGDAMPSSARDVKPIDPVIHTPHSDITAPPDTGESKAA